MQVCGRDYKIVEPVIKHTANHRRAKARVHVQGLVKADGRPIRFKSVAKAERHIRNMRLELSQG